MEGKYISDEAYKSGQKMIKKIRNILLIVGIILLVVGVVLLVIGKNKQSTTTPMDINHFASESNGTGMVMGGIVAIFFGVISLVATVALTVVAHKRELLAYQASATLPVVGEIAEKSIDFAERNSEKVGNTIGNVVGGAAGGVRKAWREAADQQPADNKIVACPHCGYKNDTTDAFCGGCGEKLEQKKFCSNCGKEVKSDDKFCPACGQKLN